MKHYRFRAEILTDVVDFINEVKKMNNEIINSFTIQSMHNELPDITVDIFSKWSKTDLVKYMNLVPDTHVMQETLEEIQNYTGER